MLIFVLCFQGSTGNLTGFLKSHDKTAYEEDIMMSSLNSHFNHTTSKEGKEEVSASISFDQMLPHHVQYTLAVTCDQHALRTRERPEMNDYIHGLRNGAKLPCRVTIKEILVACNELQSAKLRSIFKSLDRLGGSYLGLQFDLWSQKRMKFQFASLNCSFVTEEKVNGEMKLKMNECLLSFEQFKKTKHTAVNIAQWMLDTLASYCVRADHITCVTADGAANGIKAMKLVRSCYPISPSCYVEPPAYICCYRHNYRTRYAMHTKFNDVLPMLQAVQVRLWPTTS